MALTGEITKADLEMAVFLSQGEVDRYRIMLEHDIRTFQLMDEELASAETVRLPKSGFIMPEEFEMRTSWVFVGPSAEMTCDVPNTSSDVITHVDDVQGATSETGHVYRAPVM